MERLFVESITERVRNVLAIDWEGGMYTSELNDIRLLIFYFAKKRHFNKTPFATCNNRFSQVFSVSAKPLVENLVG